MKKNLLFPGFTIFITLGLLLSLAYPTSAQAQIPFEKTAGQDSLIVELVKPVAVGDMYTLDLGTATTLCIPAPGVLANDYDPDGDPITAVSPTQPANGYVILRSDGSLDYTPDPGFSGDDVFTYKASDGVAYLYPCPGEDYCDRRQYNSGSQSGYLFYRSQYPVWLYLPRGSLPTILMRMVMHSLP